MPSDPTDRNTACGAIAMTRRNERPWRYIANDGLLARSRMPGGTLLTFATFLLAAYLPAIVGRWFPAGEWYLVLAKPEWTPRPQVIGAVWTLLYFMIGVAGFLAWQATRPVHRARPFALFTLQLGLNALWAPLFFGLQLPSLALVDLLALLVCAALLAIVFHRLRPAAGWLLVPYLAWLVFAAVLNAWIVYLN